MAFEIVPAPHLTPYVCMACGCANGEPHVFIPHNQAWEQAWPFLCRTCLVEMAGALGITKAEPLPPVEVPRAPTSEEIAPYIAERATQANRGKSAAEPESLPYPRLHPAAPEESKVLCACGLEFTGPTAKAKLGSHKRTCTIAKMAEMRGGNAPGKAVAPDAD